jgi:hypothetical protein
MDLKKKINLILIDINLGDFRNQGKSLEKIPIPIEVRKIIQEVMKKVSKIKIVHIKKVFTKKKKH